MGCLFHSWSESNAGGKRERICKDCGEREYRKCYKWSSTKHGWKCTGGWSGWKSSSGGCFITTSICQTLNKPDDCTELTTLRIFRNEYLLTNDNYRELVHYYYNIAPKMVEKLEKHHNKNEISYTLYDEFLKGIIKNINRKQYIQAIDRYEEMLNYLTIKLEKEKL